MVQIEPLGDDATPQCLADIERIFFGASGRASFASAAARAEFHERWLGRYLLHDRAHAFVARGDDGRIAGYLIGCVDDPAQTDRFDDISYFAELADLTARYPAHLHINLDTAWRNQGIGARLIAAFVEHAARRRVRGVHVVTGAAARNVGFYRREGFEPLRELGWNSARIVILGRSIERVPSP
jgi:GNAT superfamily N-acetyltransferase